MPLSYAEQQAIEQLESQFSTPQDKALVFVRRWADMIIGLIAAVAVVAGLIVLASVH